MCSALTPYYNEHVLFSIKELEEENEDGVSTLFYLQKIYPGRGGRERTISPFQSQVIKYIMKQPDIYCVWLCIQMNGRTSRKGLRKN